jgi:hypothetical protein
LKGLDNIDTASIMQLHIAANSSLTSCSVRSICDYIAAPDAYISINDNAPGCNSREEVETACEVGIGESAVSSQQSAVSIFPNPSSTQITIETQEISPEFQISIFNFHGQEIMQQQITGPIAAIDISSMGST